MSNSQCNNKVGIFIMISITLLIFFVITACSKKDNSTVEELYSVEPVTKDIDTFTIWNHAKIYVIKKKDFTVRANLVI